MRIYLRFAFCYSKSLFTSDSIYSRWLPGVLMFAPDRSASRRKNIHFISVCFVDDVVRCVWRLPVRQRLICL